MTVKKLTCVGTAGLWGKRRVAGEKLPGAPESRTKSRAEWQCGRCGRQRRLLGGEGRRDGNGRRPSVGRAPRRTRALAVVFLFGLVVRVSVEEVGAGGVLLLGRGRVVLGRALLAVGGGGWAEGDGVARLRQMALQRVQVKLPVAVGETRRRRDGALGQAANGGRASGRHRSALRRLAQHLQHVVQHVAGSGRALVQVGFCQQTEGFTYKQIHKYILINL